MADETPIGLKITSILILIGGLALIISGTHLIYVMYQAFSAANLPYLSHIITGLIYVVLGLFSLFIGTGLWKKKNWARISAIIISGIIFIFALADVIGSFKSGLHYPQYISIAEIIIFGVIFNYLLMKKTKGYFIQDNQEPIINE